MFVLAAFAVTVRGVGGKILVAFHLCVKHGFNLVAQIFQMEVIHQAAEMQHVGIVALAVETVEDGHEPAAERREDNVGVSAHLHEISPQSGQIFDEDQIDGAFPCVFQHFLETWTLKISAAISIVPVSLNLRPAVEHDKSREHFMLIFYADGLIGGDVVFRLRRVVSICQTQTTINADLIQLFQNAPAFPASVRRPHCRRNGRTL